MYVYRRVRPFLHARLCAGDGGGEGAGRGPDLCVAHLPNLQEVCSTHLDGKLPLEALSPVSCVLQCAHCVRCEGLRQRGRGGVLYTVRPVGRPYRFFAMSSFIIFFLESKLHVDGRRLLLCYLELLLCWLEAAC